MSGSGPDRPLRNFPSARYGAGRPETKPEDAVKERMARFAALNAEVTAMGGWVISVPGDKWVTVETLPESAIPDTLREAGHKLLEIEGSERILPMARVEDVIENPLAPPVRRVHHAGIARTRRFEFPID